MAPDKHDAEAERPRRKSAQRSLVPDIQEGLVDAAARAIFEVRDDEFDMRVWDDLDSRQKERYVCDARAALLATGFGGA